MGEHGISAAEGDECRDRKSTRLNSSHLVISYAVFCLKKKKNVLLVNRKQTPAVGKKYQPFCRLYLGETTRMAITLFVSDEYHLRSKYETESYIKLTV